MIKQTVKKYQQEILNHLSVVGYSFSSKQELNEFIECVYDKIEKALVEHEKETREECFNVFKNSFGNMDAFDSLKKKMLNI